MVSIKKFVFSPFQENTYLLHHSDKTCWIIDPGCYFQEEREELQEFITSNNLNPTRLLNTHCHIDHVFGNHFVHETFGLLPEFHALDLPTLAYADKSAEMFGIPNFEPSPEPEHFLEEDTSLSLGEFDFEIVFVPGHAPGHVAFVNHQDKYVIGGDVLFQRGIGRTDLPGGDYDTLISSIETVFMALPDDYVVYSGHGPETTIGAERKQNPFLLQTR